MELIAQYLFKLFQSVGAKFFQIHSIQCIWLYL